MTLHLTIEQLRLGPVQDLGALSPDTPPPFSFKENCNLPEPSDLPPSYRNPKLDTQTYWGPNVGGPIVGGPR